MKGTHECFRVNNLLLKITPWSAPIEGLSRDPDLVNMSFFDFKVTFHSRLSEARSNLSSKNAEMIRQQVEFLVNDREVIKRELRTPQSEKSICSRRLLNFKWGSLAGFMYKNEAIMTIVMESERPLWFDKVHYFISKYPYELQPYLCEIIEYRDPLFSCYRGNGIPIFVILKKVEQLEETEIHRVLRMLISLTHVSSRQGFIELALYLISKKKELESVIKNNTELLKKEVMNEERIRTQYYNSIKECGMDVTHENFELCSLKFKVLCGFENPKYVVRLVNHMSGTFYFTYSDKTEVIEFIGRFINQIDLKKKAQGHQEEWLKNQPDFVSPTSEVVTWHLASIMKTDDVLKCWINTKTTESIRCLICDDLKNYPFEWQILASKLVKIQDVELPIAVWFYRINHIAEEFPIDALAILTKVKFHLEPRLFNLYKLSGVELLPKAVDEQIDKYPELAITQLEALRDNYPQDVVLEMNVIPRITQCLTLINERLKAQLEDESFILESYMFSITEYGIEDTHASLHLSCIDFTLEYVYPNNKIEVSSIVNEGNKYDVLSQQELNSIAAKVESVVNRVDVQLDAEKLQEKWLMDTPDFKSPLSEDNISRLYFFYEKDEILGSVVKEIGRDDVRERIVNRLKSLPLAAQIEAQIELGVGLYRGTQLPVAVWIYRIEFLYMKELKPNTALQLLYEIKDTIGPRPFFLLELDELETEIIQELCPNFLDIDALIEKKPREAAKCLAKAIEIMDESLAKASGLQAKMIEAQDVVRDRTSTFIKQHIDCYGVTDAYLNEIKLRGIDSVHQHWQIEHLVFKVTADQHNGKISVRLTHVEDSDDIELSEIDMNYFKYGLENVVTFSFYDAVKANEKWLKKFSQEEDPLSDSRINLLVSALKKDAVLGKTASFKSEVQLQAEMKEKLTCLSKEAQLACYEVISLSKEIISEPEQWLPLSIWISRVDFYEDKDPEKALSILRGIKKLIKPRVFKLSRYAQREDRIQSEINLKIVSDDYRQGLIEVISSTLAEKVTEESAECCPIMLTHFIPEDDVVETYWGSMWKLTTKAALISWFRSNHRVRHPLMDKLFALGHVRPVSTENQKRLHVPLLLKSDETKSH
ncbi:hypothetical protein L2734_11815 [Parashewanella spongiae]|uniref:hypothetical protein n=1 Tax=Parashewanella spongiae TaxID=342950 RepID=UPI001059F66A|nr:hypothetical protein [Parashewanella spongiae]MCL1078834.1 hypothetical protein [Parashewanella spongiae]